MWTTKFLLLLLLAAPFLAAPTEHELCPLNLEILKKLFQNTKEEILQELKKTGDQVEKLGNSLAILEENFDSEKKRDEQILEKLQKLEKKRFESEEKAKLKFNEVLEAVKSFAQDSKIEEQKIETQISAMNSSVLVEVISGFGKVSNQEENHEKNAENRSSKTLETIKKSESNVVKKLEKMEETGKKLLDGAVEKLCTKREKYQKAMNLDLIEVDSGFYFFHPREDTNWSNGKKFCIEHGMQLPTLKTADKMKKLSDANPHKAIRTNNFWVDASDVGQQPGQYLWADGTKVDAALWFSGYPQNFGAGRETCVELYSVNETLYDCGCNFASRSFICEVQEKDLTC